MKFKNYFILFTIYFLSIVATFYVFFLYKNLSIDNHHLITNYINDLTSDDYDNFFNNINGIISENSNFVLYVVSNDKIDYNLLENNLIDVISNSNNANMLLYVNADLMGEKNFNIFLSDFGYEKKIFEFPVFIYFKNGIIDDVRFINDYSYDFLCSNLEVSK